LLSTKKLEVTVISAEEFIIIGDGDVSTVKM
jgi:hypothetical protein